MPAESAPDAWTSIGTQGNKQDKALTLVFRLFRVSFLHTLGALASALRGPYIVRVRVVLLHALKKYGKKNPRAIYFCKFCIYQSNKRRPLAAACQQLGPVQAVAGRPRNRCTTNEITARAIKM